MELAPDVVVAERFRLQRPLGQGGMGSVWVAQHMGLDIPCAIKFIEGTIANDPEMRMRFEREAKAAAQLRSPNVVQIFDHGICDGTPYIAMELLVGEDLRHRLDRVTRLAPQVAVTIIEQVCRALTKAHAAGIVHRDLKPENIFLVRDDDVEIAKVLDFGIAKRQELGGEGSSHTRTGAVMGSPYYMSPEQAQGAKSLDSRSDLWSMGVIAYECLTGLRPFDSNGLGELILKICVSPLPVPSHTGYVNAAFDGWWARAASREPNGRFQTARELSDSLGASFGIAPRGSTATNTALQAAAAQARQDGARQAGAAGYGTGAGFVTDAAAPQVGSPPPMGAVPAQTVSGAVATNPPFVASASGGRAWMVAAAAVVLLAGLGTAGVVLRARLSRDAMGHPDAPAGLVGTSTTVGGTESSSGPAGPAASTGAGLAVGAGSAGSSGPGAGAGVGAGDAGAAQAALAPDGGAVGPGGSAQPIASDGTGDSPRVGASTSHGAGHTGASHAGANGAGVPAGGSGAAAHGGGHGHGPKSAPASTNQIGF